MRLQLGHRARRVIDYRAASFNEPDPVRKHISELMRLAL